MEYDQANKCQRPYMDVVELKRDAGQLQTAAKAEFSAVVPVM